MYAYAKAYKWNQTNYFKMKDGEFYKKNKPLIKELIDHDIGFKKAFKGLKGKKLDDKTAEQLRKKWVLNNPRGFPLGLFFIRKWNDIKYIVYW